VRCVLAVYGDLVLYLVNSDSINFLLRSCLCLLLILDINYRLFIIHKERPVLNYLIRPMLLLIFLEQHAELKVTTCVYYCTS